MKAIIELDIPEYQIGQEVSIYFKDTMSIKGKTRKYNNDEKDIYLDGYSDAMAFFLDKLGIENIKITNDEHVWNAVRINNTWYHIDLTWDDPIYKNGGNLTIHDYFMISTKELKDKNDGSHDFDEKIYDFIK